MKLSIQVVVRGLNFTLISHIFKKKKPFKSETSKIQNKSAIKIEDRDSQNTPPRLCFAPTASFKRRKNSVHLQIQQLRLQVHQHKLLPIHLQLLRQNPVKGEEQVESSKPVEKEEKHAFLNKETGHPSQIKTVLEDKEKLIMGSHISILNDTIEPVTIYYTLRGGGPPDGGYQKTVVQAGKEYKRDFTLSLALTIVAEYTPPGGRMITKKLDIFSPPLDGDQNNYNCSALLGHIPDLVLGKHDAGWIKVYSVENKTVSIEPSMEYTARFGFTDTKGNSSMTTFGMKISAEATFKKVFGVSVETTFGTENKEWIEQSLVKQAEFNIKIPTINPNKKVTIYQKQATFDVTGEFSDTFRVTSKIYKIEETDLHDKTVNVQLIHHDNED
mmetsp:Transcript_23977/g.36463  ORF Transcript_23977/g.36463 Transcript_23977/m.36463 type:complete len:385 (+) Transcript_23977:867-2021(+)